MPTRDQGGFIVTILLGVGGALVATYLGQAANLYAATDPASFVGGVIGAVLLLYLHRLMFRREL